MIVNRSHAEDAWRLLIEEGRVDRVHYPGFNDVTEDDVRDLYRTACKYVHPDKGGKLEDFAAVDKAKHMLLEWLEKQKNLPPPVPDAIPCGNCEGKGFIMKSGRGFKTNTLRVQCRKCNGTGEEGVEHDGGDFG